MQLTIWAWMIFIPLIHSFICSNPTKPISLGWESGHNCSPFMKRVQLKSKILHSLPVSIIESGVAIAGVVAFHEMGHFIAARVQGQLLTAHFDDGRFDSGRT